MKIQDVHLMVKDGRLVICELNKRGNIKSDCKDVSNEVLDFVVDTLKTEEDTLKTEEDTFCMYNHNNDTYKIKVTKMSDEEIERISQEKKQKSNETKAQLASMMTIMDSLNFPDIYHLTSHDGRRGFIDLRD